LRASWLLLLSPLVALAAFACASSETDATGAGASGASGPSSATSASGGAGGDGTGATGGVAIDAGLGGSGGGPPSMLYVHTNTTLYSGDPAKSPLELTVIGDFDCLGGQGQDPTMTDLAVNEAGEIWGISESNVYRLEVAGTLVHCATTIALDNPGQINFYGMTFVPKGILGADEVLLAANSAGELWSIDGSGQLQQRGTFGAVPANDGNGHSYQNAGKPWELSGDIVISANEGNPVGFATVRDCPSPPSPNGCNPIDTLVEIDVALLATATTGSVTKSVRGQIVKQGGCSDTAPGYGSVFGVAAYQGTVFGFSRPPDSMAGFAIEVSNQDGTACLIQSFDGQRWAGAGITTIAPVDPPPPK
jgi:hypothetical protein